MYASMPSPKIATWLVSLKSILLKPATATLSNSLKTAKFAGILASYLTKSSGSAT